MKGLYAWIGFRQIGIPYDQAARQAGRTQWSYLRLFRFALDGIFSFSVVPLRLWTYIGLIVALSSVIYAVYLVVRTFVQGIDIAGYALLMVAFLFFSGVQLISVGILGEYIGRIFAETKNHPLYIVRETDGIDDAPEA